MPKTTATKKTVNARQLVDRYQSNCDRINEIADLCEKEQRERTEAETTEYNALVRENQLLQMKMQALAVEHLRENATTVEDANRIIRENVAAGRQTQIMLMRDLVMVADVTTGGIVPVKMQDILDPLVEGLILDNEEVGKLLVQGPAVNTIEVWVKGLAAHAGVCPEKGISALEVAAYALAQMKLGRVDKETVANFGIVQGGRVTNVVMNELYLKGEARSLNNAKLAKQTAHMKACFEKAVKHFTKKIDGKIRKPEVKFVSVQRYPAVHVSKGHPMVKAVLAAGKKQGLSIRAAASGGGCDANILSGLGFTLPNLGVGCRNCHTTSESLELDEFFKAFQITLSAVLSYRK